MDFEFFESLSEGEADAYLKRYLEVEAREIEQTITRARSLEVTVDFTVDSIPEFFTWLRPSVTTRRTEPPPDLPEWIREAQEERHGGFRDFEEESRALVLRASYYLGQSFVESFPRLTWRTGRHDRAEQQQPVVSAFRTDVDLAPLLVAENLFLLVEDAAFDQRVRTAVSTWRDAV
jgi:hypothetical protein